MNVCDLTCMSAADASMKTSAHPAIWRPDKILCFFRPLFDALSSSCSGCFGWQQQALLPAFLPTAMKKIWIASSPIN